MAPDVDTGWEVLWNSEDVRYGGEMTVAREAEDGWHLPGESATVMKPKQAGQHGND